ncbi:CHASE2 domain-containing protein [Polycladidibacter hongkongensis]|uniref:CHASE2 domain-containing protein n=1 Tax=Polycladidibacter hongkongensis TaxID=1647556 RepID=UPI000835ED1C|nr:CHASE2 domain-containing protein [Pseudovibrio hongkongensis]
MSESARVLQRRRTLASVIAVIFLVIAALLRLTNPQVTQNFADTSLAAFNYVFQTRPAEVQSKTILLDERKRPYNALDWPRSKLARLIKKVGAAHPAAILIDLDFGKIDPTSPRAHVPEYLADLKNYPSPLSSLPDHDAILAKAIRNKSVVLVAHPIIQNGLAINTQVVPPFLPLREASTAVAFRPASGFGPVNSDWLYQYDVSMATNNYLSPAAAALELAYPNHKFVPKRQSSRGEIILRQSVFDSANVLYAKDLRALSRTQIAHLLEGRIVTIGTKERNSAAHSRAIDQIKQGTTLARPLWTGRLEFMATLALSAIFLIAASAYGIHAAYTIGSVAIASFIALAAYQFRIQGIIIDPLYPAGVALASATLWISTYAVTLRQDQLLLAIGFRKLLGERALPDLLNEPEQVRLEGMERRISFLHAKLDGFRNLYDKLNTEELIELSRGFLEAQSEQVLAQKGTINRRGRGQISAFWNAPVYQPGYTAHASKTATAMLSAMDAIHEKNRLELIQKGYNALEMPLKIAVCSGKAKIGNIGGAKDFRYAALGNCVEDSEELINHTSQAGWPLLICHHTAMDLQEFAVLEVIPLPMHLAFTCKKAHALLGDASTAFSEEFLILKKHHAKLTSAVSTRDWQVALELIEICRRKARLDWQGIYDAFEQHVTEHIALTEFTQAEAAE